MHRIMFVCHGNICRSTMAEFVMRGLVKRAGREADFVISSSATSREEIGNDTHPGTKRALMVHGVPFSPRAAVQLRAADYDGFDLFVGMDSANIRNMRRMLGGDPLSKVHKLLEFSEGVTTDDASDVADPWYTGDFETTYDDVLRGCEALLAFLR
ncbi:low molecular weight protein-tyrosine-phosphatase [Slackia piriformis]|uniref:low molecular weight protein-tyrosine-phosphatase n=1 Tax=Slackia piriformis TaxID=626934 RepID=UPI002F9352D4